LSNENSYNAIARLLDEMAQQWTDAVHQEAIRLVRWKVPTEAYRVVEAFVEREASEAGVTPDIFLRLETPFESDAQYGKDLQQQFRAMAHADRELLQEEGIEMNWSPGTVSMALHSSQLLAAFHAANDLEESLMAAFLVPRENADVQAWNDWLVQALTSGIPASVRLVLVDTWEAPVFDPLCQEYSLYCQSIEPDLDMDAVMREIAAMGDTQHPGVQYRMAFVNLTQAAGKGNWGEVQRYAEEALEIARTEDWPHLVATIYMTVAGAETQAQRYQEALASYRQALEAALEGQQDTAGQEASVRSACGRVAIQALMGQGTTQIALQDPQRAAHLYEIAVTYADQFEAEEGPAPEEMDSQYALYRLEAWRMAAYLQESFRAYDQAWDSNMQAWEAGKALRESSRRYSTLPYVGDALLRLTQKTGNQDQYYRIEEEAKDMLGEDWQSQVAVRK